LNVIGDILQPTHLLFILVIALLVLGPKRLPEVGRSLGRGLRDFRMAISGDEPEPAESLPPQPVAAAPQTAQPPEHQPVVAPAGEPATPAEHSD